MATLCPACGVPFANSTDTASHMAQKGGLEHPWESHAEALEELDSGDENQETAEGSDPEPTPDEGGDGGGGETPDEGTNPLTEGPPWRDETEEETCPECGGVMERIGSDMAFNGVIDTPNGGRKRVTGQTDPSDHRCDNCGILTGSNGVIVRNVS